MSLQLGERQRAMLAEMGIRIFAPLPAAPALAHEAVREPMSGPVQVRAGSAPARPPLAARSGPVAGDSAGVPALTREGIDVPVEHMAWDALAQTVAACRACKLCSGRTQAVFGAGDRQADWLIVGDAPGEQDDVQGEPFAGQTGKLLDNMLKALGLGRSSKVYIANVLKCRPPGGRNPEPEELAQCEPFLRRQVQLLQPRVILAMGRFAAQSMLGTTEPIGKLRGRAHDYLGVPVVVTYDPAYLLRNLPDKAKAWADLCLAQQLVLAQA